MALHSCSLSSSPATLSLPPYYSLPTKASVQISPTHCPSNPLPISSSTSTIRPTTHHLVPLEDYQAVTEAVSLANAAAEAAKDALSSALALCSQTCREKGSNMNNTTIEGSGIEARRKTRRIRKRRNKELPNDNVHSVKSLLDGCLSRSERSKYLTRKQEAEFSLHLKAEAMLNARDSSCATTSARMERRHADRELLRARECRERITLSYKRLVVAIATPYQGKGLSLQDLIQEGSIGLLRGAQRYDHRKGYKLSTYVYWWIKQAIIKAIANKSSIVRLPGSLRGAAAKIIDAKSLLRRRLGRRPTYEEIADFVNLGVSSVQLVCEKNGNPISIDRSVNGEGMALKDVIPGPDAIRPEVMVSRQMMLKDMEDLLSTLSEREEHIIRLHYGLNGETARSCDEIGRLLNLSRERIRQIHWIALTKLREEKGRIECFAPNVV